MSPIAKTPCNNIKPFMGCVFVNVLILVKSGLFNNGFLIEINCKILPN